MGALKTEIIQALGLSPQAEDSEILDKFSQIKRDKFFLDQVPIYKDLGLNENFKSTEILIQFSRLLKMDDPKLENSARNLPAKLLTMRALFEKRIDCGMVEQTIQIANEHFRTVYMVFKDVNYTKISDVQDRTRYEKELNINI